ncbi:MAG: hypothetical protein ACI9EW_000459 [Cellvibrionaceae bacterium]|jgi:hypothetical protein
MNAYGLHIPVIPQDPKEPKLVASLHFYIVFTKGFLFRFPDFFGSIKIKQLIINYHDSYFLL